MSSHLDKKYEPSNLPYRIAVICYLWSGEGTDDDKVLMLHRAKEPNIGRYSPIGGKLEISIGESPHECAVREIEEESGVVLKPEEVRLLGVVSEKAYAGENHWLLFMFEATRSVDPSEVDREDFDEGRLEWVGIKDVVNLNIPETDAKILWPIVQRRRRTGFFMVDIDCSGDELTWNIVDDRP